MQLEAFNRSGDPGGAPEMGADNPPNDGVLAERYPFLSRFAPGLAMGVGHGKVGLGGDVAFL